jgi:hypothetical protein
MLTDECKQSIIKIHLKIGGIIMTGILEQILLSYQMPKRQVEGDVALFLEGYFSDILNLVFYNSINPIDPIQMVAREYPIKKTQNNQSIVVDVLLANRKKIFLLELKTSSSSFREDQIFMYINLKKKILEKGGGFLISDLDEIKASSREASKYDFFIRNLRKKGFSGFSLIRDAEIIYLAPEKLRASIEKYGNIRFISFSDLHKLDSVSTDFKVITNHFRHIDFLDQNKGYTMDELLNEERKKLKLLRPIIDNLTQKGEITRVDSIQLSKQHNFPNYVVYYKGGTSLPYNGRTHEIFNRNGKAIHHFNQKKMGSPIKLSSLLG